MSMQKSIRVSILGKKYPLRVHEKDEAALRAVANTVDARMRSFKVQHPDQPDLVAAVISALALAEEMLAVRETSSTVLQAMHREMLLMEKDLLDAMT